MIYAPCILYIGLLTYQLIDIAYHVGYDKLEKRLEGYVKCELQNPFLNTARDGNAPNSNRIRPVRRLQTKGKRHKRCVARFGKDRKSLSAIDSMQMMGAE